MITPEMLERAAQAALAAPYLTTIELHPAGFRVRCVAHRHGVRLEESRFRGFREVEANGHEMLRAEIDFANARIAAELAR